MFLTGQWMLYPGYVDEAAADAVPAPQNIYVGLRAGLLPGQPVSPGAVSYRFILGVSDPEQKRLYALTIPGLRRYVSLSVNGESLYDSSLRDDASSTLFFSTSSNRISIILQSPP